MCTYGLMYRPTVGWYIGRLSVDYRSTIGRQSVDYRSTIDRLSVDISADCRPINVYISGDALADYRSIYRSTIGRLSAYMSTEATYSTHDPKTKGKILPFVTAYHLGVSVFPGNLSWPCMLEHNVHTKHLSRFILFKGVWNLPYSG